MKSKILTLLALLSFQIIPAHAALLADGDHTLLTEFINYIKSQDENLVGEFGSHANTLLHTEGWYSAISKTPVPNSLQGFIHVTDVNAPINEQQIDIKVIYETLKSVFSEKLNTSDVESLTYSLLAHDAAATREILAKTSYFSELHDAYQDKRRSDLRFKPDSIKHFNDPALSFGKDIGPFTADYDTLRFSTRDLSDQDTLDWVLPILDPTTSRENRLELTQSYIRKNRLKSALAVVQKVSLPFSLDETKELITAFKSILTGWSEKSTESDLIPLASLILTQHPMTGTAYSELESMVSGKYPNSGLLSELRKLKSSQMNKDATLELAKFPSDIECKAYAIRKNRNQVPYLRVTPLGVMHFGTPIATEAFAATATAETHWSERIGNVEISYDLTLTYQLSQNPIIPSKVTPNLKSESHTKRKQNVMSFKEEMTSEMSGYQMAQIAEYDLPDMSLLVSGNYFLSKPKSKQLHGVNVICTNEAKYFRVAEQMYMVVTDQLQKEFVESLHLPENN